MQRRLGRFLPIVMLAMLVQFLAPVSASWAFAAAASDPLHLAGICSSVTDADDAGGTSQHQTTHACCTFCGVAQAAPPAPDPQSSFVTLQREAKAVLWRDHRPERRAAVANAHAQARAPPVFS